MQRNGRFNNNKNVIVTFQVTIMFYAFFVGAFYMYIFFYYDRLIGILFMGFFAIHFELEF